MDREWVLRNQLIVFFILAYAITWAVQIPAYLFAYREDVKFSNEANTEHFLALLRGEGHPGLAPYLLLFMFTFGPSVAGVIVTALVGGRAGLAELWSRVSHVGVGRRWIAIILLLPIALALSSLGVAFVLGGFQPYGFDLLVPLSLFVPLLVYMLVCTGLAEEIGWRGYALPELQRHHTAEKASWILGIGWGLWHIPSVLIGPYLQGDLHIGLVIPVLLGLTLGIVGWTIVITWIYNHTQSVFWIIVLHGWNNTVQSFLVLSAEQYAAQVIFPILPWLIAVWLLKRYGTDTLTRRRPESEPSVT
jgi:membrane protease YdiL (CAAX protease family)